MQRKWLPHRGEALKLVPKALPEDLREIGDLVLINYREYRLNAKSWSFTYFSCVFGSAVFSAMAGVVLKLTSFTCTDAKNDLAATLAAIGALLVTLSTAGDFQRKWRSNRIAANALENLAYELLKTGNAPDRDAVLSRIQEINERRTEGIVGEIQPDGARRTGSIVPAKKEGEGDQKGGS